MPSLHNLFKRPKEDDEMNKPSEAIVEKIESPETL